MSSDYKEDYSLGFEEGKIAGKKEIIDLFNNSKITNKSPLETDGTISIRDRFATAVLSETYRSWISAGNGEKGVAAMAYNMADAMLEERAKRG